MHVTLTWSTKVWNRDEVTEEVNLMASLDPALGKPIIVEEDGKQRLLITVPYYRSKASAETIALISEFSAKYGPTVLDQKSSLKAQAENPSELINKDTGAPIVPERPVRPASSNKLITRLKAVFKQP